MKKFTKLMLTLAIAIASVGTVNATKLYATYGTPASSGSWDAENQVYTWTASYSNLMTIFEFPNNDLGDYTSLHLTTSNYVDGPYRVCFMNGGTLVATIAFYSAGQKDLVFSERDETKDLDLSKITHISFGGASGSGSISLVGTPYLVKPTTISFDETGVATIGITDIDCDANLTFNDQTGEMASTGQGTFSVSLSNEDFSNVTKVELLRSGDDIVQTLQITDADNGVLNTWYGSKYSCNFTDYQSKASKITKLAWNCNTAGTMTVTGIRLTASVITANNPHYTDLTKDMFHKWTGVDGSAEQTSETVYPSYELNSALVQGSTVFGDVNVSNLFYADLTAYDKLVITGTSGTTLRVLLNRQEDNSLTELNPTFDSNGCIEVDLSTYKTSPGYVHLNAIKRSYDGKTASITSIKLYKAVVSSPYDYVLSGSGVLTASVTSALADATATSYDATGITVATELTPANPNALFVANEGVLTNTKNVIVGNTCANLVLTDQKPFKAPAAFTAANATFTKTMTDAEYATMMIPFTAAVPSGLVARDIKGNDGDVLITEVVDGNYVINDAPVLLKGAAGSYVFTENNAKVAVATGIQDNGLLYGTYDATYNVPENSYVLQKQGDEVKFFKAIDGTTVKAFRAYLDLGHSEGSLEARNFTFDFENEATGLQQAAFAPQRQAVIYNLQGQRIAQPAQGLYIKGGKKVIIK